MTGAQPEPVAWSYELATVASLQGPTAWKSFLTSYKPDVPEGWLRNLTPLYAALQPVSISRASQGSGAEDPNFDTDAAKALAYVLALEIDPSSVVSMPEDAEKARYVISELRRQGFIIAALSPPAAPQAPEDVRARAIELMLPYLEESEAMIGAAVDELGRAHLLATSVTVTMEECWRHVKSDTLYTKVGIAELQMSCDLLVDGSELVVYRGEDGKLWCREVTEFENGRFVPVLPAGESP